MSSDMPQRARHNPSKYINNSEAEIPEVCYRGVPSRSFRLQAEANLKTTAFGGFGTEAELGPEGATTADGVVKKVKKKSDKKPVRKVVVDDFGMVRILGKGKGGQVFLAEYRASSELYALKAITKRHVLAHQELQHTLTEQAVLKRMARESRDPFVVKLWWSFHDKENLFLVMDFHPGGDLATQLARWGRLGRDRARFYAAEIVEGCEGLHAVGVIYRGLEPENILIGADGHIVLTDFGLSKEFPRKTTSQSPTAPPTPNGQTAFVTTPRWMDATGLPGRTSTAKRLDRDMTTTFCGTAEYLAPEVIQGLPYSYEVDWWSFGTMLYEMLTGVTPFWANNHSDMYVRVLQDELQFPDDKAMDQDTKGLIRGLLQRNPALRMCEPRVKKHPYFSMFDWQHVYYKRYIPPYIPPIDPLNMGDTQNFDDAFLDMEPITADETDHTDSEREDSDSESARTASGGKSPKRPPVEESEETVDVFDGYSSKGRDSILIYDEVDEDDEEDEHEWAPHVWDPQLSRANITASFSSPSLPPWLSWNDNVLNGTPGPDAINTDITVHAKVLNDPDEYILSHTFHLTIAPSAVDPAFVKSRRPSMVHDVRRNVSDSAVTGNGMRARAASTSSNPSSDNHQVMQVLASAVSRVTHAAHAAQVHNGVDQAAALVKQQQVLGVTAQAVADEVRAGPHPDCQGTASVLVAAAHSVVVGAAQLVATDRVTQATRNAVNPNMMAPTQSPISVTEVSVATQSAVAHAVALNGPMATEVEVMMTANALIQQQQITSTNEALEASQATSHLLGGTPSGSVSPQLGQIGDHRSRSMSSLGNPGVMPMNVGMITGLGPGLDNMPFIPLRPSFSSKHASASSTSDFPIEVGYDNYQPREDEYSRGVTQQVHSKSNLQGVEMSGMNDHIQSLSGSSIQSVKSNEMTSSEMFECLIAHGCSDLRAYIHPDHFSSCRAAEGAFGDVWKGKLIDGTDVAIKVLRYALVRDDGSKNMKRVMREIYNWSKLDHKNIHKLLGVTMFQGRLGMVSIWMEHGTLQQYLKQHSNADRHALCCQIAEGVAYLHSVSMIHGDLKAGNILVSVDGILKLTDFDYSIISGLSLAFSATTRTGGGTLRWMAPELVLATDEDPAERSKQTDVYALGMTILASVTSVPTQHV
ncbi:hypothetical protein RSAG8_05287, partial [Rhizoctonia solani AG-8 WAC10335]